MRRFAQPSSLTAGSVSGYDFNRFSLHSSSRSQSLNTTQRSDSEREADEIATQVMESSGLRPALATQRRNLSRKQIYPRDISASGWNEMSAAPVIQEALQSPAHSLDQETRGLMETRFGYDFGRVRLHSDAKAAESARALHAQAYTVGHDIVFAPDQCDLASARGRHLLAHELTHVVRQQREGVRLQRKDAEAEESEKWKKALKGKDLPTARSYADEEKTPFFVEGMIETSKILAPYLTGKLAKTSVGKKFTIYGSDEEFESKAQKLVGEKPEEGTRIGGFYHRPTDSIHLPPRAPFASALHEGVHKYSSPVVKTQFDQFLNEGITQYFTDRVLGEFKVEGKAENAYEQQLGCAKTLLGWLKDGETALGEAYFQGKVMPMRETVFAKLGLKNEGEFADLRKDKGQRFCQKVKEVR